MNQDLFSCIRTLQAPLGSVKYYSLKELEKQGFPISSMPFSIRILVENALRNYDGLRVTEENVRTILGWSAKQACDKDIPFMPARVLLQDFTGVPCVVDLASLRAEAARKGKEVSKINPHIPVDLVIDHSVQVEYFGNNLALDRNVNLEYKNNAERYMLLKWAQKAFNNFAVVPPGMGICHQVNLEYLSKVVLVRDGVVYPDSCFGTDSHTPMVNGIGVVAWGVGGIEAEAAMLGQPSYFIMPEVVGLKLTGKLPHGATATDLVLAVTQLLRKHGVVGKFVEVFGDGLDSLAVTDRATIGNMSPEFGCTITYFPVDHQTLEFLRRTARDEKLIQTVEAYCKENMLWRENESKIQYSTLIELDLNTIEPAVSGPKRPQDRILLKDLKPSVQKILFEQYQREYIPMSERWTAAPEGKLRTVNILRGAEKFQLSDGAIVIAAITSCTNTSNPSVMLGAGLVAKKAVERGLDVKPWVKTSLAPGSRVVTQYLEKAGLSKYLDALKFHTVGYGCTTCIGNSGPLPTDIDKAITDADLAVAAILSGNRNFEARIHPNIKMNFLASPMLVVVYAIAGHTDIDVYNEPIGYDRNNEPVYMKDIWPDDAEIAATLNAALDPKDYASNYATAFDGDATWKALKAPTGQLFEWDAQSTYVKEAPFFQNMSESVETPKNIVDARTLLVLGDSITTDHISPAGSFKETSPAGKYLTERDVAKAAFNSYGSRRGNHEVMMRGTFANVRIKNKLASKEGGYTLNHITEEETTVFEASEYYIKNHIPTIILGGKEYGNGSSRDWAAKGPNLLGVKAVIAESFERIHRSNLVGMGILPLLYIDGQNAESLGLTGKESYSITGIEEGLSPHQIIKVKAVSKDGKTIEFNTKSRLDSQIEIEYYKNGGILNYVLRQFLKEA
ncbi:MAG: aconitate hydratase AcnA [Flavobacteriales bacterium]|nr:aconitate hydratase AcnA [Flavobacteriales bacterium]